MNYLAYWSLRIGGFVAWNGHRKRNAKINNRRNNMLFNNQVVVIIGLLY